MTKDGIYLDIDPIQQAKGQSQILQSEIENLRQQIQQIKGALNWQVLAKENIDGNLQTIMDDLTSQEEFLKALQEVLVKAEQSAEEGNTTLTSWVSRLLLKIKGILGVTEALTASAVIGGVIASAMAVFGHLIRNTNSIVAPTTTGTGSESTNVSTTEGIVDQGTFEERRTNNINEMQTRYEQLAKKNPKEKGGPTYEQYCGNLTTDQLLAQGLITESDMKNSANRTVLSGKKLASFYAEKGTLSTGATCTSYGSIDELVNSNQQPITNVICSFNGGGIFKSAEYGHAMLISKIEDDHVYFMDNRSSMCVRGTADDHCVMQCMTIQEFKNSYYNGTNPSGITMIRK